MTIDSALYNRRNGIMIPRRNMLPPYLKRNPYFTAYADIVDQFMLNNVDLPTEGLRLIRDPWVSNPTMEALIQSGQMIDESQWTLQDRATLVRQANSLGMRLQNAGVVTDKAYQALIRFVGTYWFGKGTQSFIEFINFCLDVDLKLTPLWTNDYKAFIPYSDVPSGSTILDGVTNGFYPTTHVAIEVTDFTTFDPKTVTSLFNDVANYNLVLYALTMVYKIKIISALTGKADLIFDGIVSEKIMYITTLTPTTP